LARIHFDQPNNFVLLGKSYPAYQEECLAVKKETMKVSPLSERVVIMLCLYGTKMISVTEILPVSKRELRTWGNFSSHMNKV
jgi:hypothetical protein